MKTHYYFCLLFAFFIQTQITCAQQWRTYTPTQGFDINTVAILQPGVINIGGGQESASALQVMLYTNDYGYLWNENMSSDGFAPWNKSIVFFDTVTGYGVGDNGRIIKTVNSGIDWYVQSPVINRSLNEIIWIKNTQTLFIAGGARDSLQTILKSNNGGQNWNTLYDQPGKWLTAIWFTDTLNGIAVGDSGIILKTTNGGTAWTPVNAPVIRDFTGVTFIDANNGFISGGLQDSLRTILKTINGGSTWTILKDEDGGKLNDIYFTNASTGYVTGDSATLLKTSNAGQNWNSQSITGTAGNESFRSVRFYSDSFGLVAGKGGALYIYAYLPTPEFGNKIQPIPTDTISAYFKIPVNTHTVPSHLSFRTASDTLFLQNVNYSYGVNISNDTFAQYGAYMTGYIPNKLYYMQAILNSAAGDFYSSPEPFYLGVSPYDFGSLSSSNVTFTGAQLHAVVNKIPIPLQLKFNYGTTPALGSQMAATPSSVNDSLVHTLSATLNGLQPNSYYYYILEGDGFAKFYSDTLSFYTGINNPIVQTYPGADFNDTSIVFSGTVQRFLFPATTSFLYGTTPALGSEATGNPYIITDTSLHAITQFINGLQPHTIYYFCLKAKSPAETLYGDTLQVYSGKVYDLFNTLAATNVTATSADLNAVVKGLEFPCNLSFEYGPTTLLGSEIPATQGSVSDTLLHNISAQLTGLTGGMFYYYRLKAVTATGFAFYSDIRQVFVGPNEIPNWDFEFWQNRIAQLPADWIVFGTTAQQVSGHTGSAIKLNRYDIALSSMFTTEQVNGAPPNFIAGKPFHARPDSIWFYLKSNSAAGDTPQFFIKLYGGGAVMAADLFTIPRNTGGVFQRFAHAISYSAGGVPDTIVMGFGACLQFGEKSCDLSSNITVDDIGFSPPAPVVPNADFENWYSSSYNELQSWLNSNIFSTQLDQSGQPCVTEVNSIAPNDHAASIQSYTWKGIVLGADMLLRPSFLASGPHFSVLGRHETLTGYFKSYPVNGDTPVIIIKMYKAGVAMGFGILNCQDSVTAFTPFVLPIHYEDSTGTVIPDSASIEISSYANNRARGNSTLVVDKLRFDNSVVLATEDNTEEQKILVYPNPAQNILIIETGWPLTEKDVIKLKDINGKTILKATYGTGTKTTVDLTGVNSGFYLLQIESGKNIYNKKVVIVK